MRVCLVSASGQNVFFTEILEAFGEALRAHGVTVEKSVDCFPAPSEGLAYLFVPHEYHPLVDELAHPGAEQLQRSVALCTEQPGTHWFDTSCAIAAQTAVAIDINEMGADEMRRRGITAHYVPLGYVPSWDHWRRAERERSVDVTFLGAYTDRRAVALARSWAALAKRRAAIYLTETVTPHLANSPYFLSRERKWNLMADSRVLVNVHRSELPYLEWHRVLGAILNGCVVLSEQMIGFDPLVPGEHFFSARLDDIPLVLEGLLEDPARLEKVRNAAYDIVLEQMPLEKGIEDLLSTLERIAAIVSPVAAGARSASVPLPLPPPRRPPEWEAHAGRIGPETLPIRMALKYVVLGIRNLERSVAELAASENPAGDVIERLGETCDAPRLSVLLSVYNYADHVGEALQSVAVAEPHGVEIVAVDDCSTDHSVQAIRQTSERLPWLPITLVRRGRNQGLPAARNLALKHARADRVFILDADNVVLPLGLSKLMSALDEHPTAAFAYGLIECFDAAGSCDVMNWIDWDRERLRYGNYIDAMAMIRRSALEEVEGYSPDPSLIGLEDFAVWLAMASAGMHGVRVPDFVARYRRSPHAMISLTSIDSTAAWATLLRRYPSLAASGGLGIVEDAQMPAA